MIEIWKPLMQADTGIRKVSLAIHKVMQEGDVVKLQFTYKRKDGSLIHPYPFLISKQKAMTFPKTTVVGKKNGGTVACVEIPLFEFKEDVPLAQHSEEPVYYKTENRKQGDMPTRPCWNCGSTKFNLTSWGEYVCVTCHPSPSIVAEIDIKEVRLEKK